MSTDPLPRAIPITLFALGPFHSAEYPVKTEIDGTENECVAGRVGCRVRIDGTVGSGKLTNSTP